MTLGVLMFTKTAKVLSLIQEHAVRQQHLVVL